MISAGNSLNSSLFFWWAAPIFFIFEYFWWVFALGIVFYFPILRIWWWFFFPLILYFPFKTFYLYWLRWDIWYKNKKWILLEIKPPKEILKPFKAMEDILEVLWGVYDSPCWREAWCEGMLPLGGGTWLSFEIVSFGGKIHFFARIPAGFRRTFETAFYAHYPEIEIREVEDYTKNVPQDIPNEKWDLLGEDYCVLKPHCYPIKTYPAFFEEIGERIMEEKRIDPINSLLENMAKLSEGEQFWFHIVMNPIADQIPFREEGERIVAKIARRPEKKKESMIWKETKKIFVPPSPGEIIPSGKGRVLPTEEEKIEALSAAVTESGEREMIITPRERAKLLLIETKISKTAFQTWMRGVYIYRKDKPGNRGNALIARAYLGHFKVADLNGLKYWGPTRVKIRYMLRPRRLYLRKRKLFRNCVQRFPPLHPEIYAGEGTPVLNIEELATIFHFPTKIILPEVPRIEAKPGGPPAGLPTGELPFEEEVSPEASRKAPPPPGLPIK